MRNTILASVVAAGLLANSCSSGDPTSDATPSSAGSDITTAARPTVTTGTASEPAAGMDPTFGARGVLVTPISPTTNDRFISVAEGPGDRIYATGYTALAKDHAVVVARFDAEGALDPAFGKAGVATINVAVGGGSAEVGRGLVVQADGKVVVTTPFEKNPAATGGAAKDLDVAVIRLDASGALDASFGEGGIAKLDLGAGREINEQTYLADNVWGLTARRGGYAVFGVTASTAVDRSDLDYAVAGMTSSGKLDATFGTAGILTVDLGASADSARHIAAQSDGKLLATGYSRDRAGIVSPVLIRLGTDGKLDAAFGKAGVANHQVLPGVAESYQVALQGDGYVLAGYGRGADPTEKVDMIVYRFRQDGSWDTSFGTNGITRVDLAKEDDRGRNLTLLPDGRILVVGSGKRDAQNVDAMVVLLDSGGVPVTSFGESGHLLVELGGPSDAFFGVTVTEDDNVVVAGYVGADPESGKNDDAVLARLVI